MFAKRDIRLIIITLISVILMGLALAVLNIINWGNDPFTFMNIKISEKIGWSLGNWQVLLNILMFIPVIIWAREQIGFGTIFNMVLVGYSVQFFSWIFDLISLEVLLDNAIVKSITMIPALVLFVFAAAMYMSTGLGTAPNDALPFLISKKITVISFKWIRLVWDFSIVTIGFVISGEIGVVTILMVLFMGQTISFVKGKFMSKENK